MLKQVYKEFEALWWVNNYNFRKMNLNFLKSQYFECMNTKFSRFELFIIYLFYILFKYRTYIGHAHVASTSKKNFVI